MDILAARKKAMERSQKKDDATPPPQPEARPAEAAEAAAAGPPPPAETPEAPAGAAVPVPAVEPDADADEEGADEEREILSFRLGEEEYAVTVDEVREVLKLRPLTVVPNTPDYVLGVASLRGTMLPVIDLALRLGFPKREYDEKSRIIVVRTDEEDVGLLVDRVTGVNRIARDAIRPVPENIEQGAEFLRGIARRDDRLFILLDLDKTAAG